MAAEWIVTLAQQVSNGVLYGLVYALIASGLSLIFGILQIVNFAHGEFYMLGAFLMFAVFVHLGNLSLAFAAAVLASMVLLALFGIFVERSIVERFLVGSVSKSAISPVLVTLGLSLALRSIAQFTFGATPIFANVGINSIVFNFYGVYLQASRLVVLVVVPCVFLLLTLLIRRTRIGMGMRAAAQNKELCEILGMNRATIYAVAFAIGAALAGLAGALVGPIFVLDTSMGGTMTLKGYAIVVVGGFGNVKGAIYVSILVGLVETFISGYVSGTFKDLFVYGAMMAVLLFRPEGVFGKKVGIW